jgi:hypothetical protein
VACEIFENLSDHNFKPYCQHKLENRKRPDFLLAFAPQGTDDWEIFVCIEAKNAKIIDLERFCTRNGEK